LGKEVEIKMGYEQNNDLVFQGIIENHRISLKEGFKNVKERSLLIITCVDKAIGLVNNYTTEVFKESSDSEIIASLTNKISGLSTNIESTSYEHPFFPKYNNCDWNFIKDRANYNGQFLINSNNQLAIKTPVLSTYLSNLTIINGQGTISFEASINGTNQIDSLGINQSNSYTGEETSKTGNVPDSLVESSSSSKSLNLNSDRSIQLNISQDMDPNEISILADSMLRQNYLERIQGKAKFRGVLDVDLDQVVTLEGFGARFDGDVYITAVNHQIEDGQIFTAIEFGIKNNLIKPNIELDLIPKSSFISGLHIGEITQIDEDPDNQFRVKVLVPALNEFSDGIWARLSHFYTVSEGGLFYHSSRMTLSFLLSWGLCIPQNSNPIRPLPLTII
jgi:phage protein D